MPSAQGGASGSGGGSNLDGTPSSFVAFKGVGRSLGGGGSVGGGGKGTPGGVAAAGANGDARVSKLSSLLAASQAEGGGGGPSPILRPPTSTFFLPPSGYSAAAAAAGAAAGTAVVASLASAPQAQQPLPAAKLLSALPTRTVTAAGHVVDVRGSVASALEGGRGGSSSSSSSSAASAPLPPLATAAGTAMLKVRLDGEGSNSIVLHLRSGDTVAYLLACVAGHRVASTAFELRSAAPPRSFSVGGASVGLTLEEAGLTPTAALFVRPL